MATRKTWAHELAARCRRVDWKVTRGSTGGYKVTCPDDFVVQMHMTSSDVNAPKTVLRLLEQHGLAEAEAEWEARRKQEATEKLAKQREEAEEQALRMAQRSKSLAKAAGPYAAPEPIDLEWALAKHPAPWMRWVIIGPEDARAILERNSDNRPLSDDTSMHYAKVILAGLWRLTHQGVAMDQNAVLQDGQHRLWAIIHSGVPAAVPFFVGMDPDNFKAIDEGKLRKAADLIGKAGEKHATTAAGAVRLLVAHRDPSPRRAYKNKQPNAVGYDTFMAEADQLRACVEWSRRVFAKAKIVPTALAAARFLLYDKCGPDNRYVTAFFEGLANQCKPSRLLLDDRDPRVLTRRWIENKRERGMRVNSLDMVSVIILSWNYVVDDYRPRFMRWADDMAIPEVRLCADRGPLRSDPPPLLADELVGETEES